MLIHQPVIAPLPVLRRLMEDRSESGRGPRGTVDRVNSSIMNQSTEFWDLGVGFDGARDLLAHGWPAGVEKMRQLQKVAPPQAFDAVQRWRLDYAGSRPCVPAYLGGDMRAMWRRGEETSPRQLLRLGFIVNAGGRVDAADLLGRAIAYCELIQQLEQTGVDVEVYAVGCNIIDAYQKQPDAVAATYTLIKPAGQHVQPDIFLGTIGHPAFFRRVIFKLRESSLMAEIFPYHPYCAEYGRTPRDASQPNIRAALIQGVQHYQIAPSRLEVARQLIQKSQPFEGLLECHI